MTAQLKALRLLVRVRRREGERLEASLAQARRDLAHRHQEAAQAADDCTRCTVDLARTDEDLSRMMSGAFTPAAVRAHGFRVDDLKAAEQRAQRELRQRQLAVEQAIPVVQAAQAAKRRNDQRIARFQERIDDVLRAREAEQEERAEEEIEEAAIARHVARTRAAREAAQEAVHHG